jgi:hypothetical protein
MSFEKPLKLVKTKEAAKILGRSPSTMAKDRMRGTGCPYVKDGASVRYDLRVLEKHAAEHTRRSTSEYATAPREFEAAIAAEPPAKPKLQKRARPAEPAPAELEAT